MVVRFHVVAPVQKQRTFTVRLPVLLGRGEEAKFRIQHDLISRRHCELFESDGRVCVRDLGSTNGTFLDDAPLPAGSERAVPPGGTVRVGGLSFTVDYAVTAPAVATAAAHDDAEAASLPVPRPPEAVEEWSVPDLAPTEQQTDDDQLNAFFRGLE